MNDSFIYFLIVVVPRAIFRFLKGLKKSWITGDPSTRGMAWYFAFSLVGVVIGILTGNLSIATVCIVLGALKALHEIWRGEQ